MNMFSLSFLVAAAFWALAAFLPADRSPLNEARQLGRGRCISRGTFSGCIPFDVMKAWRACATMPKELNPNTLKPLSL